MKPRNTLTAIFKHQDKMRNSEVEEEGITTQDIQMQSWYREKV